MTLTMSPQAGASERYDGFDKMPIAGTWRSGSSGGSKADLDPWSGDTLVEIPLADAEDVDEAYRMADHAQPAWAAQAPAERAEVMRTAAAIFEARKDEIINWIVRESGGTLAKGELEWGLVRSVLYEAASMASHVEGRIMPSDVPGKESRVYRRPVGVVAVISPWNFPLQLSARSVAPALAVGNAVVLKPAGDTPGFRTVPYGDVDALKSAMDGSTVGVLIEPIQGEAGVNVPPSGFLRAVRDLCTANGTLMIADEIQSGLGRTGTTFACEHEDVVPDVYVLGKALGGGIMPVSAVVADADILGVFRPGQHGSTFGGNPLACAIGREVVAMLKTGEYQERSRTLGAHLHERLGRLPGDLIHEVRGRGLWAGVELHGKVRPVSERLMDLGVLAKETHETTLRLAPPLIIDPEDLDWALDQLEAALKG